MSVLGWITIGLIVLVAILSSVVAYCAGWMRGTRLVLNLIFSSHPPKPDPQGPDPRDIELAELPKNIKDE